jgi:hypothetical protein
MKHIMFMWSTPSLYVTHGVYVECIMLVWIISCFLYMPYHKPDKYRGSCISEHSLWFMIVCSSINSILGSMNF